MVPQALLGQAEGAEWVQYERRAVPSRALPLQTRQQAEVGLSWGMVSEWWKGARHLECREDGHG